MCFVQSERYIGDRICWKGGLNGCSLTEMVKRKAEDCLDRGFESESHSSHEGHINQAAAEGGVPTPIAPTAEQGPVEASKQTTSPPSADVAAVEATTQDRFWSLLERAGYEVW